MLDHLMHLAESSQPARAHLPDLVATREGALTPPHSTIARGYDNLYYHYHDLVAISMGTGGWVFKI